MSSSPGACPQHEPWVESRVGRQRLSRTNDHQQAGERYRSISEWERDDLVLNLVDALSQCDWPIQERMIEHLSRCDAEYGRCVAEGIGLSVPKQERQPAGSPS